MSRSVKIALFGLLGGLVCVILLREVFPGPVQRIMGFLFGFLAVALLAAFATKEKSDQ